MSKGAATKKVRLTDLAKGVVDMIPSAPLMLRHAPGLIHRPADAKKTIGSVFQGHAGAHPERPFVLLCQQSQFDPSRAPAGQHTAYAYCHVPAGSTLDQTAAIERQVERFAPGFRDRILADLRAAMPVRIVQVFLHGAMVADGLATIDLSSEIDDIGGPAQKKAFAQIVFTALGFDEVERVRFLVDGKPVDAPTDDGNLAEVTADDYDPPLNPR